MAIETAIFLGAGASKADGAPLQGELFDQYFRSEIYKNCKSPMESELATFFGRMFEIDVNDLQGRAVNFPTFEEALGLTDLAILRKEGFRNFDLEDRPTNCGRLPAIAQYLVFLVAKVLDSKLTTRPTAHRILVDRLQAAGQLKNIAFISTNYDIVIDNALTEMYCHDIDLDYGVEFRNFDREDDWKRPRANNRVCLFKPHGSLNWLLCPTCNALEITPKEKGVLTRVISDKRIPCPECQNVYSPLVVPPTFYKDFNNIFLSEIWNRTEKLLRLVQHVVFCGYSFPDADMHIKYLLKRAQTNRNRPLKFTVINSYRDKPNGARADEEYRFKRFLGAKVNYTALSFEEFVTDPIRLL